MSAHRDDALASFYRLLWPDAEAGEPRGALFDRDFGGRAVDEVLYEHARGAGLGRDAVVLDVGCGKGQKACELAKRLSCRVIAIDPLEHCLALARKRAELDGVARFLEFRQGELEELPVGDGEIDLVWCLDTFNHVRDIGGSFRELARVLKPEGMIFNCSALETPSLEPAEKNWICRTLSLNPETLSRQAMEHAIASSGLRVQADGSTSEAGSRFLEAVDEKDFAHVKNLARMARDEPRLMEIIGERDYAIIKAHALWNTYWLIGKIAYRVWILGLAR